MKLQTEKPNLFIILTKYNIKVKETPKIGVIAMVNNEKNTFFIG